MRIIKIILAVSAVLIVLLAAGWAVYGDKTTPPRFGPEAFETDDWPAALQRIADATVKGGAPGVIIHIRKDGIGQTITAGIANKATGQPMPANLPLRIASVSKIYTAAIILDLVDKGEVDVDALIADILPAETLAGVPNADQATIRQLLHHTSGIPDYYDVSGYLFTDWTKPISLDRMLPVIRRNAATGTPGEAYAYSNAGYLLLGEIAETLTNRPLGDLIADTISTPLSLEATHYNVFQTTKDDIHGYGTYLQPWKDTHEYWEHSGPDGGMMASASDVSALLSALLIEDSPLSAIGAQMTSDFVKNGSRRRQGLGLETIITRSGEELFGHTGDVFGYQTIAHAYPDRGIVVVAHINCNCTALTSSLLANLYRAVQALDGAAPTETAME